MATDRDGGGDDGCQIGEQVQGVRLLRRLQPLLARLHDAQCARDKAGNRTLHYDELCCLILLTFFNPTFKTLRDLNTASRLKAVRRKLGCSYASTGAISEAFQVFAPQLLGLFFRWLKCVLSCRHLLSKSARGIQIQIYCALIACLLIQLSCPIKPNRQTFVAISLYLQGWATEDELWDLIQREIARANKTK
jgi:hypothetical protein